MILLKANGGTENWRCFDTLRSPVNQASLQSIWSTTSAQQDETGLDFLSNGFKLRGTDNETNDNGDVHIYMAFAQRPFVSSEGVPSTAVAGN